MNRGKLRAEMANWLRARAGDAAWQTGLAMLGESGLALEVAEREAARARELLRAADKRKRANSKPNRPVVAGADVEPPGLISGDDPDDVAADGDPDALALLEGSSLDDSVGPYDLQILVRFIGAH